MGSYVTYIICEHQSFYREYDPADKNLYDFLAFNAFTNHISPW